VVAVAKATVGGANPKTLCGEREGEREIEREIEMN
jgi:hypothetical protein